MGKRSANSDVLANVGSWNFFPAQSERKSSDPPLGNDLPTLVVEIVQSRVIAHLKAKNEKNAVESSVWSYFPGLRKENGRKTSELEKSGFGCFGVRKVVFRHEGDLGNENAGQIRNLREILG